MVARVLKKTLVGLIAITPFIAHADNTKNPCDALKEKAVFMNQWYAPKLVNPPSFTHFGSSGILEINNISESYQVNAAINYFCDGSSSISCKAVLMASNAPTCQSSGTTATVSGLAFSWPTKNKPSLNLIYDTKNPNQIIVSGELPLMFDNGKGKNQKFSHVVMKLLNT